MNQGVAGVEVHKSLQELLRLLRATVGRCICPFTSDSFHAMGFIPTPPKCSLGQRLTWNTQDIRSVYRAVYSVDVQIPPYST